MARARNWCFTLNNPDVDGPTFLSSLQQDSGLRFVVFQLESGDSGTPHFQGYAEFTAARRLPGLQALIPGAHLEVRRGSRQQAIDYCSKDDTRISGPWTWGQSSQETQGTRNDIALGVALLQEGGLKRLREEDPVLYVRYSRGFESLARGLVLPPRPVPPDVHLLYGPTGCGKTRHFYDTVDLESSWRLPLTTGMWFDGYEGQSDVLIDDFVGAASHITLAHTLQLLDRYPIRVAVKGSFVDWRPERIFVTTNLHPRQWYKWESREEQFPALCRRFTQLHLWRRDGTVLRCDAGSGDAKRFYDGFREPESGEPRYDGLGAWVTREPFDQYSYY